MVLTAAERRLKGVLRAMSFVLLGIGAAFVVGMSLGPLRPLLAAPPWPAGVLAASLVGTLLCMYAGGDPRRRGGLVGILIGSLAVTAAAGAASLLLGRGHATPLAFWSATSDHLLLGVVVVYGVLAAAAALAGASARRARLELGPRAPALLWPAGASDAGLHLVLPPLGALFAAVAAAAGLGPFVPAIEPLLGERLLAAHTAGAAVALTAVANYIATDTANRLPLVSILVFGAATVIVAVAASLLTVGTGRPLPVLGWAPTENAVLWLAAGTAAAIAIPLFVLKRLAFQARCGPRFLGTTEYRSLIALADVIVRGPVESVPPLKIAANVDGYLLRIRARRRWVHRAALRALQLHPVLYLRAPLSELDEESRLRHLKTHFHTAVLRRVLPDVLRRFVQGLIRVAQQLTYAGYYNDPLSHAEVGYQPFRSRERFGRLVAQGAIPAPAPHPLVVIRPGDLADPRLEADVCIVGSGAAGAVLAYQLAQRGLGVLVLERGQYVEPREFTEDEVEMIGKLYADGIFQQTEDFRFTVLQGSCVGGTTVVNNAVSFRPPAEVLERWNVRYHAGIDAAELLASAQAIERWLPIVPQEEGGPAHPHLRLNPSYRKFLEGVERMSALPNHELRVGVVEANIRDCVGCGYCNIGCAYGKKLSMLDTVLPWAQRDFGDGVRIIAECEAVRVLTDGRAARRATGVRARLSDGRTLIVNAGKVVLAAGAIASSYLLLRSGIGRALPVGQHLCFNMGAPLTAEFEEDLAAFDGLQISHYAVPRTDRGWVFETWWNPPASQAVNMPGWFEQHFHNMSRYPHLMAVGALVGTERNARVGRALTGGPAIHYQPTTGDMRKLGDALIELGHILFAAGARRVMVNGWEYYEFTSANGLYELPAIMRDPSQLALGTGHPQGGNAMSRNPSLGVVAPDFRVHGYADLYVCDASVIPSSLTVNPQLTVMALAHYAAPRIAGEIA